MKLKNKILMFAVFQLGLAISLLICSQIGGMTMTFEENIIFYTSINLGFIFRGLMQKDFE